MEDCLLSASWKNRPMTAREHLAFSKGLLQKLAQFDSVFSGLFGWGRKPNQKTWFTGDFSDFDDKIFPQINEEDIRYQNPNPDNWNITLDSTCFKGFSNIYSNTDKVDEGKLSVSISAGATDEDISNLVNIEFPKVNYPQFYEYDFVSALTKIVVEYCQPEDGFVISDPFWDAIKLAEGPKILPIGWLTYLADLSVNNLLPPDIEREVISTGGSLITLKHSLPSAENEADVAAAIRIRDTLMPVGLLEW